MGLAERFCEVYAQEWAAVLLGVLNERQKSQKIAAVMQRMKIDNQRVCGVVVN